MATLSTRTLGGQDAIDRQAVRVNGADYKDKWGIIEVVLTSYTTSGSSTLSGNVDLRPANYNPDNDEIYVNNVQIAGTPGTVSITKKFYVAVNNGVPGPSVRVNPDGTWDLLVLTYGQKPGSNIGTTVTLNYTISAFLNLTSTSNPADSGALSLVVDSDGRNEDNAGVSLAASGAAGLNGRVLATINWVQNMVVDQPPNDVQYTDNLFPAGVPDDPAPYISVLNSRTPSSPASQGVLLSHQLPKISGTIVHYQRHMVFAVNNGKIDGNGRNAKISSQAQHQLFDVELRKVAPADDTVWVSIGYSAAFTSM
jgi:hypothetical protein